MNPLVGLVVPENDEILKIAHTVISKLFIRRSYFEVEARSGRVLARKGFASVPEDLLPFRLHLAARLALSLLSLYPIKPLMHRLNMK